MRLRAVDPKRESARDVARRVINEYRARPFSWRITPEEFAIVEAATIRERQVNWDLVRASRRMKKFGSVGC